MCVGIPACIVALDDNCPSQAVVDVAGVRRIVNISCVLRPDQPAAALIGQWTLIHVGFAMSLIDEDEARRTLELLMELGEAQAELEALRASGRHSDD